MPRYDLSSVSFVRVSYNQVRNERGPKGPDILIEMLSHIAKN